jgi:hypothetical protein
MTNVASTNTSQATPKARFREAYERALPDMAAVPESELLTINLDIPSAVATALGACRALAPLREQVMGLHDFDLTHFDKLETYALALWQAHSSYVAASTPVSPIPELAGRAAAAREQLLSDTGALAKRGLVDGARLEELRGAVGYKNVAVDIGLLVTLLRARWSVISGKTALTSDELDAAEALADELITTLGQREQAPRVVATAANSRTRAFSLLVKTYDQVRRAINYLRWNERDLESIAPSLYAGRRGRIRRKGKRTDANRGEPATTTATAPHAPATAAAPTALAREATEAATATVAPLPADLPAGDPRSCWLPVDSTCTDWALQRTARAASCGPAGRGACGHERRAPLAAVRAAIHRQDAARDVRPLVGAPRPAAQSTQVEGA